MTISIPGAPQVTEHYCRSHEAARKIQVVKGRPKKPADAVEPPSPATVRCAGCGRYLQEAANLADRPPCPDCGSRLRNMAVGAQDHLEIHDSVESRVADSAGKRKHKARGGDSFTRDLEAWGKLGQTFDDEHDLYREVIELWDGTRIESVARLSDHRGKRRSPQSPT